MRQSIPAVRISSSNALRCSGEISGSSAPMHTSTEPLMLRDSTHVAAIGYCFGGTMVLGLADRTPPRAP
jgi:hypothetical protein